ncbi:MAG TPA: hypothetical protein VF669_14155 [Tepidisphaeraceae bacterium]|jgi:hypothetical protein
MARTGGTKNKKISGKVGSSPKSAKRFGGKTDFGVPADSSKTEYSRRKSREIKFRPGGSHEADPRQDRGSTQASRVSGVGKSNAGPGGASAGDIDTDVVGVDGRGLAQGGPDTNVSGPEWTTGGSEEFASGGPAKGENQSKRGRVGAGKKVRGGTTVDRSGGDAHAHPSGQINIEEEVTASREESEHRANRRRANRKG